MEQAQEIIEESIQQQIPKRPVKPRRRPRIESEEEYIGRIRDWEEELTRWEDSLPPKPFVQLKGNSMT